MTVTTRSDILTAAQTAIVAAGTDAGSRVYVTRSDPVHPSEMPAVLLTIDREQDELLVEGQSGLCTPEFWRRSEFVAVCLVVSTTDALADTALTTLTEQVREVLLGTTTALSGVYQIDSVQSEYYVTRGDAAEFSAACKMTLSLRYPVQYGV